MSRLVARLVLLAVLTTSTGCALAFRRPAVAVTEAEVTERSGDAMRFDVTLELSNRNTVPLELREFVYSVSLDGKPVFQGRRSGEATLAALDETTLSLPAVVRMDQLPSPPPAESNWTIRGEVLYLTPEVLVEILLDSKVWRPRASFSGNGRIAF